MFGRNTSATLVVKTVLFHVSLNIVKDWPQPAPLTKAEIKQYIDGGLLPLVEVMMIVDNDAWNLFDRATKERYRQEALVTFGKMRSMIAALGLPT